MWRRKGELWGRGEWVRMRVLDGVGGRFERGMNMFLGVCCCGYFVGCSGACWKVVYRF